MNNFPIQVLFFLVGLLLYEVIKKKMNQRLIDANALQDKMHDECCGECESCKKYIWNGERSLCGLIEEVPTVEERPHGKWTPVSERLPETEGDYLLWGKIYEGEEKEYIFIGSYDKGCEKFGIWEEQFDRHTLSSLGRKFYEYSIVAWQPLLEPYKEADI